MKNRELFAAMFWWNWDVKMLFKNWREEIVALLSAFVMAAYHCLLVPLFILRVTTFPVWHLVLSPVYCFLFKVNDRNAANLMRLYQARAKRRSQCGDAE